MTDHYNVAVRLDGTTHFLHRDYAFDAPVNGGGFFDNFARAIESGATNPDDIFDTLGYDAEGGDGTLCWTVDEPHVNEHKIPVLDVALDRVFITEDGTPKTLITSFSRDEFVSRYKR